MIPPVLKKWRDVSGNIGLLVFAQALQEMLFDYTLDSFKVPALNLHLSVIEVRRLCIKYYNDSLKKGALDFSINELAQKINSDVAVTEQFKGIMCDYVEIIRNSIDNKKKLLTLVQAMSTDIEGVYWEMLKERLVEEVESGDNFENICQLSASFATELEIRGFSREYVYSKLNKFFFNTKFSPYSIYSSRMINDFIRIFEVKEKKWDVIIKGKLLPSGMLKYCLKFGVYVKKVKPSKYLAFGRFVEFSGNFIEGDAFYIVKGIDAKDPRRAHYNARNVINFLADVCRFHDHSISFYFDKVGFVSGDQPNMQYIFPMPKKPMECGVVNRYAEREEYLNTTIDIIYGRHFVAPTKHMFVKVLDFHHAAIDSSSYENQLLDLWAALEGFLPKPFDDANKIKQYIEMLIPVLLLNYNYRLLRAFSDDLFHAKYAVREHIEATPIEGGFFEKVVAVLVLKDLESWWDIMVDYMANNPLLKHRCFKMREIFKDNKSIEKNMKRHEAKLQFHLRRIYTMRNQIAHDAESMPYIRMLVENLHNYFDSLIIATGIVGKNTRRKISIDIALELLASSLRATQKELKAQKFTYTPLNYIEKVFGRSNVLSPNYSKI